MHHSSSIGGRSKYRANGREKEREREKGGLVIAKREKEMDGDTVAIVGKHGGGEITRRRDTRRVKAA